MTISSVQTETTAGDSIVGGVVVGNRPESTGLESKGLEGTMLRERRAPRPAAKSFERRRRIVLSCAACGGRNYRKTKARREGEAPLALKKFCNICNAHTQHREAV